MKRLALASSFTLAATLTVSAQTNTFPSSGNVGIGITSPQQKLSVDGYVETHGLLPASNLLIRTNPNDTQTFQTQGSAGKWVFTNNDGGGNVGIGITAPATRLEVKGNETRLRAVVNKNDGTLRNLLRLTSDDTVGTDNLELSFGIQGGAGGSRRAQIQAADNGYYWAALALNPYGGNVGVGTTAPATTLSVSGSNYPQIRIDNPNALASGIDFYTQVTGQRARVGWIAGGGAQSGLWLWNYDNSNLIFGTTNAQRMTIDASGNVGIGTTNPTHKLAVNGTIKAKEVIVETTGWSDYVFADGYALQPLAEVEAHIKTNKHLPGIPSAAQVTNEGISVGDMQAKLLAKIEELTLHQIAQEKELASLRQEVRSLRENTAK